MNLTKEQIKELIEITKEELSGVVNRLEDIAVYDPENDDWSLKTLGDDDDDVMDLVDEADEVGDALTESEELKVLEKRYNDLKLTLERLEKMEAGEVSVCDNEGREVTFEVLKADPTLLCAIPKE